MSYLYRTGNSRNNIAFTNTANSSTKYLRRLGSGRTNINWYTIPQGSTYNILQRNGTGRNNILWSNLNIPIPYPQEIQPNYTGDIEFSCYRGDSVINPYWKYNGNNFFYTPFYLRGDSNYSSSTVRLNGSECGGTYYHQDVRTGGTFRVQYTFDTQYSGGLTYCSGLYKLNFTFKMGNYWLSINVDVLDSGEDPGNVYWYDFKITATGRNYSSIGSQSGQVYGSLLGRA